MDLPFLEEAGLSGGDALFSQVLVGVVNAVTTVIAVFIIDKVGRKKLVYYGVSGMILSLLLIGFYFSFAETRGRKINCVMRRFFPSSSVGDRPAPRGCTSTPDERKVTTI